ncbi:MAG: glycosyltransferase family 4 protein, partial [Ilumatobacteraceae bacterium]
WGDSAMDWARAAGRPGILEVNAPLPEEQAHHRVLHDRAAADRVAADAIGAASAVIAVSEPVADWVRAVGGRADLVHVVANAVDVDRFRPACDATVGGPTCTIGFVGTLKAWHGLATLAEAFERLAACDASYRLLVVGDGPERAALEGRLDAAGLAARVEFAGAVDPADVPQLLRRIDIAVAPYPATARYFSPLKLYEYLATGVPVVASLVGQAADVLDDGRTGLLSRPDDPQDLAAAILALRADPSWADAIGRAGRRLAEQQHTWRAVVDRILSVADCRTSSCAPATPPAACGAVGRSLAGARSLASSGRVQQ